MVYEISWSDAKNIRESVLVFTRACGFYEGLRFIYSSYTPSEIGALEGRLQSLMQITQTRHYVP